MNDGATQTFEELFSRYPEPIRTVAARLRDLIKDVDPEVVEVIRAGDKAASYQVGPQKMKDGYCYLQGHASWVNLGFYQGTALSDPAARLEGTGAKMRHVKVRTIADADAAELRDLVVAAASERRAARA